MRDNLIATYNGFFGSSDTLPVTKSYSTLRFSLKTSLAKGKSERRFSDLGIRFLLTKNISVREISEAFTFVHSFTVNWKSSSLRTSWDTIDTNVMGNAMSMNFS